MKNYIFKFSNFKIAGLKRGMINSIFTHDHSEYSRGLPAQAGMTYVELIVVLGIFGVMSSVIMFNYGGFQAKVDIKNLASDIALQVAEAQKSALSGKLPANPPSNWKPAYGIYFNDSTALDSSDNTAFNKKFVYFADLDGSPVNGYSGVSEKLNTVYITKGNYISQIDHCTGGSACAPGSSPIGSLSIVFKRPDSAANFIGSSVTGSDYVQITVMSPKSGTLSGTIKIYPSGRVQVS